MSLIIFIEGFRRFDFELICVLQ